MESRRLPPSADRAAGRKRSRANEAPSPAAREPKEARQAAASGATAASMSSSSELRTRIAALILELAQARAAGRAGATICPSEVARAISSADSVWRPLMPVVRDVAAGLIDGGEPTSRTGGRLVATQRGAEVDLRVAKGPVRLKWVEG